MAALAAPAPAGATSFHVETEGLVVQLDARAEQEPAAALAGLPGGTPELLPGRRWATELPAVEAAIAGADLTGRRGVDYVSPVAPVVAAGSGVVPNNPCYQASCGPSKPVVVEDPALGAGETVVHPNGQTDLWAVGASQAWAVTKGNANILVAVLDTGVDPRQAQLLHRVIVGPNVCAHDRPLCRSPYDQNGHGTFVSGLIAAATNDGIGIAGLGWNTRVLDIKVLDESGNGNTMDEATGIYDAVAAGAKVINLSSTNEPCTVNATACGPNLDQAAAVQYALARGVVVVAAAGNYDSSSPVYPADYPGVLSVAASTDQGVVDPVDGGPYLDFSDYGPDADIAAPGINVLSTWDDGNYAVESGTSFAAPHVAAAAALVFAADPSITGPQVATLLQETATPLSPGGVSIGGGLLNVAAAVEAAASRDIPRTFDGYELFSSNGKVYGSGVLPPEGSPEVHHLAAPIVGAALAPGGLGYWLASADGGVFAIGPGAHFFGSAAGAHLATAVTGIAATPDGRGYWLVNAGGQVLAFGDAHNYGSTSVGAPRAAVSGAGPPDRAGHQVAGHAAAASGAGTHRSGPDAVRVTVTGIAATPDGRGYWLVNAGGQVFAFGDAHNYGSLGKFHLSEPIVGLLSTPDGHGYWLVGKDGGVFAFGGASYFGSEAKAKPDQAVVGMAIAPEGRGYWLAGAKGEVWAFGPAATTGPTGASPAAGSPLVAIVS